MPTDDVAFRSSAPRLPRISIALGTYNGERFLDEQLGSLARQTVLPAELIASDDCSSDNTLSVLEQFAREAPFPVRILRNASNVGFTANMIRAAEQCEGPLIAFCDQDDVWSKDKVELCARFFAHNPIRLLLHSAQPVDESLRPIGKRYPAVRRTFVAPPLGADPWLIAPGFALVMDKGLLGLADWRSRPLSRDLDGRQMDFDEWFYFLAWSTGEIGFLSRCLVLYRQHGRNVVGSPDATWANRLRKLLFADFATHRDRAIVARAYADFLEGISRSPSPDADAGLRQRLSAGASRWQAYEERARQRDAFYAADSFGKRLNRLWQLAVVARAYRSRESGGLGRLALVRDLRELAVRAGESVAEPARRS
jgi:glycosyltransferase involved in cell wall biosynthesis